MNKRGISEIVSYTLLIVIALTMAVLVFNYLRLYVPKNPVECKDGISLIVEKAECSIAGNNIKLVLQNRGRFKIDRAFIRIGKSDSIKTSLHQGAFTLISNNNENYLNPQESTPELTFTLPSIVSSPGDYILEVQPAYFTKEKSTDPNTLSLCTPITNTLTCQT